MRCTSARNVGLVRLALRGVLKVRDAMAALNPALVRAMRDALDEAMTRVPTEYATSETKAYLAECILKAAAQGHTTYNELVAAAGDQIQNIISAFT
jgi:hypothetical protein